MKWAALAVAIIAILPFAQWLRSNPNEVRKVWFFAGALPFVGSALNLDVSIIDWAIWPGYAKGIQISLLDILAVAIFLSQPTAYRSVPYRFVMALYFISVVLSIFQAQVPMAAVFYAWQLARMFLLYVIVTRACSQEGVPSSILTGIAVGLCFQALMTVWQRWGGGALQAGGTFGHQNFLGFVTHFALFPLFALLLAGVRGWQTIAATLAGLVVAALTTSRATVGLVAIGLVVLFVASSARSWTARKQIVLLAALIILPIMSIFVLSSFQKRFTYSADSTELSEREAFQLAASMMLSDHPMGIGANNYVVVANLGGYMENAGVAGRSASRATLVHNAYWVAAVETGYLGLIALALLMFRTTTSAFRASWQNRSDVRGDLLLGLGVSLLIVSIHNMFEWMFFMPASQYLFAMTTGLIAGLSGQLAHRSNGTVKLALRSVQTRPPRQHSI